MFRKLPKSFCNTNDISIIDYDEDGRDHDYRLKSVMQIYRKENVKLNKDKCQCRCMVVHFISKIVSRQDMQQEHCKTSHTY